MPKAIKKKLSKKEHDTETDVQERLVDIKKVFEKRQKTLVSYGLVALSAVVVIGGIVLFRFNSTSKAHQLEYEAYKTYYSLYQKTPLPDQEKMQKALDMFQQAYEKKKSPRLLLFIAEAQAELNKHDDALKTLDDFIRKYAREETLMPLAYQKTASIHLRKGNKEEAKKALDKIAGVPGDILKDYALVQAARMLEQEGKKDEAAAKYKELSEKYPTSPYAEEIKAKLGVKNEG